MKHFTLSFIEPLKNFWICHPALYYGLSFFLGAAARIDPSHSLMIPCAPLWLPNLIPSIDFKRVALSLLVFITGWCHAGFYTATPLLPEGGIAGKAHLQVQSVRQQRTFFGNRWVYKCRLKEFAPAGHASGGNYSLPCTLVLPAGEEARPPADRDYWVEGKLIKNQQGSFLFKVSKKTPWIPIEKSSSWAESRYQWKKLIKQWIESKFSLSQSGTFLAGLLTGEFDDHWMRDQFARFGLQHLLAISGFHFAIFAAFLGLILRLILPDKVREAALLCLLLFYCLFLGPQASILRAWIMCSLALIGLLLERHSSSLNSLGLALLILLVYDPLVIRDLGFQLSFAATFSILLFYQPIQKGLEEVFPRMTLNEALEMNQWNQHGLLVIAFIRESLALALAVNIFALPLTLFHFNQFPWMSLLFNLFYPLLVSLSFCLLFTGLLFEFLPPLSKAIHFLNGHLTHFILQIAYQTPSELDGYLQVESLAPSLLILYLTGVTVAGFYWKEKMKTDDAFFFI